MSQHRRRSSRQYVDQQPSAAPGAVDSNNWRRPPPRDHTGALSQYEPSEASSPGSSHVPDPYYQQGGAHMDEREAYDDGVGVHMGGSGRAGFAGNNAMSRGPGSHVPPASVPPANGRPVPYTNMSYTYVPSRTSPSPDMSGSPRRYGSTSRQVDHQADHHYPNQSPASHYAHPHNDHRAAHHHQHHHHQQDRWDTRSDAPPMPYGAQDQHDGSASMYGEHDNHYPPSEHSYHTGGYDTGGYADGSQSYGGMGQGGAWGGGANGYGDRFGDQGDDDVPDVQCFSESEDEGHHRPAAVGPSRGRQQLYQHEQMADGGRTRGGDTNDERDYIIARLQDATARRSLLESRVVAQLQTWPLGKHGINWPFASAPNPDQPIADGPQDDTHQHQHQEHQHPHPHYEQPLPSPHSPDPSQVPAPFADAAQFPTDTHTDMLQGNNGSAAAYMSQLDDVPPHAPSSELPVPPQQQQPYEATGEDQTEGNTSLYDDDLLKGSFNASLQQAGMGMDMGMGPPGMGVDTAMVVGGGMGGSLGVGGRGLGVDVVAPAHPAPAPPAAAADHVDEEEFVHRPESHPDWDLFDHSEDDTKRREKEERAERLQPLEWVFPGKDALDAEALAADPFGELEDPSKLIDSTYWTDIIEEDPQYWSERLVFKENPATWPYPMADVRGLQKGCQGYHPKLREASIGIPDDDSAEHVAQLLLDNWVFEAKQDSKLEKRRHVKPEPQPLDESYKNELMEKFTRFVDGIEQGQDWNGWEVDFKDIAAQFPDDLHTRIKATFKLFENFFCGNKISNIVPKDVWVRWVAWKRKNIPNKAQTHTAAGSVVPDDEYPTLPGASPVKTKQ